ncbi:MAG: hypothetical protein A2Y12_05085 [Planctomycetes bacterium GWF2_42_9]|nr:MAG: hypothetical protein A2Y12_05085 [Planctomycetes bacterium GWF2_42_9]HAL44703.1 hypothetical protein [Phycisphaerales bacterium]
MSAILSPKKQILTLSKTLRNQKPRTKNDLKNYLKYFLDLEVCDSKMCEGHDSPMDYLWHSYNCDFDGSANGDCIVWGGRGGGKTYLAAVATLLDCVFKPGCKTRILAGSQVQAQRMYDYLLAFIHNGYKDLLIGKERKNKCKFVNGSNVEVLTQSMASVRGSHIHKLRCDEIELFKKQIFEAAKFTTKSNNGITAAMEALSTMHQPFGIMHDIVNKAQDNNMKIFKWCIWEVIENCGPDRNCSRCVLNNDCKGKAKRAKGYLKIEDVIAQMKRCSRAAFESEMLCLRPSLENVVFAEFDPEIHIQPIEYNPDLPLYRAMDFGFVNPFVCLWIQVDEHGTVRVIDEYIQSKKTIDVHANEIKFRKPYNENNVIMSFCDPAGAGVNDVTGTSPVSRLRAAGIKLRFRPSEINVGVELVRRALKNGEGKSSFAVNPRCGRLIEAMQSYHYPPTGSNELPQKDGVYDHPIDALRYFFVNYNTSTIMTSRKY